KVEGKKKSNGPKRAKPKAGHFIVAKGPKKGEQYKYPNPVDSDRINKCAKEGWFSKHIFIVQHWLNRAGFRSGHSTGYWDDETQKQYDKFRRSVGYKGKDAKGTVGAESLAKLAKKAKSPRRTK